MNNIIMTVQAYNTNTPPSPLPGQPPRTSGVCGAAAAAWGTPSRSARELPAAGAHQATSRHGAPAAACAAHC